MPANTILHRDVVDGAFLIDSYRVPLGRDASVVDIFFAVFGHHPTWLKFILLARHRVGAWFGLDAATTAQIMRPARAASYRVGESIGPWPIYFLGEEELVAGRDAKHLDFRVSVLKQHTGPATYACVSTVGRTHNRFGRLYLRLIVLGLLIAWVIAFVLENRTQVSVHFVLGTARVSLVWVILLALGVGLLGGILLAQLERRRRRRSHQAPEH